jgi:hypothetical protein
VRTNAVLLFLCLAVLAGGCAAQHRFGPVASSRPAPRVVKKAAADLDAAVELVTELKYKEAAAKLGPLTTTFADARDKTRAAEATFWLGYCREKLGDADEARKAYELVAKKYPDTPAAGQAHARLTRLK